MQRMQNMTINVQKTGKNMKTINIIKNTLNEKKYLQAINKASISFSTKVINNKGDYVIKMASKSYPLVKSFLNQYSK